MPQESQYAPSPESDVGTRLTPLHRKLFDLLPDEGQMHAFEQVGVSVKFLRERLNRDLPEVQHVSSGKVQAQLQALAKLGLVRLIRSPLTGGTRGWCRTRASRDVLPPPAPAPEREGGS